MKRKDLLKMVKAAGYELVEGGNHTLVYKGEACVDAIPRHSEINEFTARAIMKRLGLKK